MLRTGLLAAALIASGACVAQQARADSATNLIAKWDPDHDGTLDQAEVSKAAAAEFATLDVDHDGTLDAKEVGRRITSDEFRAADKDHDGTLDLSEYESIVAQRFHAANPDNDTTIEAKEMRTSAGRRLAELLPKQ